MEKATKYSTDNINYDVLHGTGTVNLPYYQASENEMLDDYIIHHLYVYCKDVKDTLLPLDANPREPSISNQVKDMQKCICDTPREFFKLNNGMTCLCESVEYVDDDVCSITFGEGEGVCNGGHTYFSIVTLPSTIPEDALVHIELIELPSFSDYQTKKQEITNIARARNNNNQLKRYSEADYLGYYDQFKEFMSEQKLVSWHENDSEALSNSIGVIEFMRALSTLDVLKYYHPLYSKKKSRHKRAATQGQAVNNEFIDEMESYLLSEASDLSAPMRYLAVLGDDVFSIKDILSYSLLNDRGLGDFRRTSLYTDYVANSGERSLYLDEAQKGYDLSPTFEAILIGLFRTNIWLNYDENEEIRYVGWFVEPKELWNLRKEEVLVSLFEIFNDAKKDPKVFIRTSSPYEKDLFVLGYGQTPPSPQIIYKVESGEKYCLVEFEEDATHCLTGNRDEGLIEIGSASSSVDCVYYVQVN